MGKPGVRFSQQDQRAESAQPAARFGFAAPGLVLLVILSATWSWWAWKQGAYFGVVLLPGTVVLCLVALLYSRIAPWPAELRLSRPAAIALAALVALGCWEALSAIWSPAPDAAIADGQRVLVYALSFGLGIWLCLLLRDRMTLCLLPLAFAAAVVGVVAAVALATGSDPRDYLEDGTVDFPIGYRNAQAAFFGIALFCALGLASDRDLGGWLRAAALGTATLCLDLFLLAESRGSVVAMTVGLIVYTLASPKRVRALSWLLLAAIPAAAIVPALTSLYHAAHESALGGTSEMHTAGVVAGLTAAAAVVLGALAVRFESRLPGVGNDSTRGNRPVALGLAALALAAVVGFVVAVGDPVDWIDKRAHEFRHTGTPNLSESSSRFTFNAGSHRYDLWRVALDDAGDDPLLGDGGGGFQYSYLRKRTLPYQQVHDAHSVELETLAEFGIPGLAMLLTAIAAAGIGALRAARAGPESAVLGAIALASGAYWLVHTSTDWFWPYPAITAPLIALMGSACAGVLARRGAPSRVPWRALLGVAVVILAVSAVPPFLAQRYINQAYSIWRTDPQQAQDDLDRAQDLNRLSDAPMLAEGAIATVSGDQAGALAAFKEAEAKQPEEWATHFLLARAQQRSDPAEARRQAAIALELNPLETRVRNLARRLHLLPGQD
jgi:hypothetical protein